MRSPWGCKESDRTELNRVVCYVCLVARSRLTLCDPTGCSPHGSSAHGDSPGKNTGVGCHALFQGIFPTCGWNPGLPYCRRILYLLSHLRSPMYAGSYTSTMTLSVNGLNAPTKRHRLAGWIKKIKPISMLSTRGPPQTYGHFQTESKGLGEGISCKWKS